MKRRSTILTFAAAALCATPLAAQQGERGHGQDHEKMHGEKAHAESASMKGGLQLHRAEKLEGAKLSSASGQEVGELQGLVLDASSGEIVLAIVSTTGGDMAGRDCVVPWSALRAESGEAYGGRAYGSREGTQDTGKAAEEECRLVLQGDVARLRSAPAWTGDHMEEGLRRRAEEAFGSRSGMERDRRGSAAGSSLRVLCSDLKDVTVQGRDDEELGEVETVFLDADQGRVAFVLLGAGGMLGMGEKKIAVPWKAFDVTSAPDEDSIRLSLAVDEERLASAPEFPDDEARASDPSWVREVYAFFSVSPYWDDARARPAGFERQGTDGGR